MYSARTKLACEIAGIEPLRLNEAHHSGDYHCLPGTIAGKSRVFQVHDIIGLRVFVLLTNATLSKARAGEIACTVQHVAHYDQTALRKTPKLEAVTAWIIPNDVRYLYKKDMVYQYHPVEHFPGGPFSEQTSDGTFAVGGDIPPLRFDINVRAIREQIVGRLQAEANVLGED